MACKFCENEVSCFKYNLLKVIVYSSIDIVDKGRPCLVINRKNTWFLVMCELHCTCIHVKYNYSLHDLNVELSFSWCLIMLITKTKMTYYKLQKYFFYMGGVWFVVLMKFIVKGGEIFHIYIHHIFTQFSFCVSEYVFLYTYFWIFSWFSYFSLFSFQNFENLKVKWICMPVNVWCLCDVANVFIKGEIVKSCVMCNIGKC